MKRILWMLCAAAGLAMLGSACGSGVNTGDDDDDATPTPGSYALSSGSYDLNLDTEITDTCWADPKPGVGVPTAVAADVAVDGSTVTLDTSIKNVPMSFQLTRSEDDLSGSGSGSIDLNSQGIDCIISVAGTLTGTVTGDDAFSAEMDFDVTQGGGSDCSLAVGTLTDDQLDQLPCQLVLGGAASLP